MNYPPALKQKAGFTLAELSIVIVIIGLLVGGIVAGREMIRAAEIRSMISQITSYEQAYTAFEDKYSGVPGDLSNATTIWAAAAGNGNGDGLIDWNPEAYYAWQQLALAGMIPGSYTGTSVAGAAVIDGNIPRMGLVEPGNTGILLMNNRLVGGAPLFPTIWWGNQSAGNLMQWAQVIGGAMAWGIPVQVAMQVDQKMDDGVPSSGKVQTNNHTVCTMAAVAPTTYNLAAANNPCWVNIILR